MNGKIVRWDIKDAETDEVLGSSDTFNCENISNNKVINDQRVAIIKKLSNENPKYHNMEGLICELVFVGEI